MSPDGAEVWVMRSSAWTDITSPKKTSAMVIAKFRAGAVLFLETARGDERTRSAALRAPGRLDELAKRRGPSARRHAVCKRYQRTGVLN
jgi:hypothetical protein